MFLQVCVLLFHKWYFTQNNNSVIIDPHNLYDFLLWDTKELFSSKQWKWIDLFIQVSKDKVNNELVFLFGVNCPFKTEMGSACYWMKLHPVQLPYCFSFDSQRGKWQHDRAIETTSQQDHVCFVFTTVILLWCSSGPPQNQRPWRTSNCLMHWKYGDNVNWKCSVLYIIYVISELWELQFILTAVKLQKTT